MSYSSLQEAIRDLEANNMLIRIKEEIDPNLEMAEIQRRAYSQGGPAVLYEKVKGSPFPAVSNLFGKRERANFLFRHSLEKVKQVVGIKADPLSAIKHPFRNLGIAFTALSALPKKVRTGPVFAQETSIDQLPQIKSWPDDGGPFITLPQVLTIDPDDPKNLMKSNVGMYRIQMGGNEYIPNEEVGLHYQIHRGIGIHHSKSLRKGAPLKVSIFVGGPPAHTLGAIMPLPEGLSELTFAGMLAGRRFRIADYNGWKVSVDSDFCILGEVHPGETKPEGPFGDHLGYYSLKHDFPVMKVVKVFHRDNPVLPFTVVGRPPQEDTFFGNMIHEITRPMVPVEIPGIKEIHAIDEAGVHPLLLAIGRERYVPYQKRIPQEILTGAHAILGFGQASLAKYLLIAAEEDNPELKTDPPEKFFHHILERIDFQRDLHFQTKGTIDTLDYSGTGLNAGSKVILAAAGEKKRALSNALPEAAKIPESFKNPRMITNGILALEAEPFIDYESTEREAVSWRNLEVGEGIALVILTENTDFVSESFANFLWVTFTRSNPSHDIYGVGEIIEQKHWGCQGPLIIDARRKPHHAPPLKEDPQTIKRVDRILASVDGFPT